MKRLILVILFTAAAMPAVYAQLYDYSLIGQTTSDYWDGSGDSEFSVHTDSTGIQFGQSVQNGLGTEWAATVLLPLRLQFDGSQDNLTSTMEDLNFGFGLGFRYGLGYAISLIDRLVITPGLAWHLMYIRYSFDFPGGASQYYELTHGPAATAQVSLRLIDEFWLQGGVFLGLSPFHSSRVSISGDDEDMQVGLVSRGWIGVRVPLSPGSLF